MQLEQARILVTGATGGIGRALALRFQAAGAGLLLTARSARALQELMSELGRGRQPVECVAADLLTRGGVGAIVEAAERYSGGINAVVNNAGRNTFGLLTKIDEDDLESIVATNLLAPMRLARALLPELLRHEKAAIVNIGSLFGAIGYPGNAAYCASKFGLRGFTEALRRELADTQIAVLHVAPRAVATEFNSPSVVALNEALANQEDSPTVVAEAVLAALFRERPMTVIGAREGLFARINALFPGLVEGSIRKRLPLIKQYL